MKPPEPDLVGLVCRCVAVPGLILYFLASFTAIALSIRNRRRERCAGIGDSAASRAIHRDISMIAVCTDRTSSSTTFRILRTTPEKLWRKPAVFALHS